MTDDEKKQAQAKQAEGAEWFKRLIEREVAAAIDQHCANVSVSIVSIACIFAELKQAVTEMKGRLDYLLKNDTATITEKLDKLQLLLADRMALLNEQSQAKDKIN